MPKYFLLFSLLSNYSHFLFPLQENLVFQDPYRKKCYATSKDLLARMSDNITQRIRDGIEQADLYIITLGFISTLGLGRFSTP